jgi:hypothetical protein
MPRLAVNAAVLSVAAFLCAGAHRAVVADEAPSLFITTQSGTVDCEGHDVNVTSSDAKLSFTGRCKGIYFVGTGTTATIESAELVQSSGNGMHVTVKGRVADAYLIGSRGEFVFDDLETLHLNGDELRVGAKTIGKMAVVGSRNTVHWSSGKPRIDDIGSGNVLQPKP